MRDSTQLLRQQGLRATGPRLAVLAWLQAHPKPVSADGLHLKLKGEAIDRVTVYRILESLRTAGLVRTVDLGHGHVHYEFNDPARHHHHLVCEECGSVTDITIENGEQALRQLARRHTFQVRSHSFEIFGCCAKCQ